MKITGLYQQFTSLARTSRARPDAKREEVVEALAQAYANVLLEFNQSGLWFLRLQPISSGTFSGPFQIVLLALTAEAIHAAYRRLPPRIQATLQTTSIELCIYDESEHKCYIDAFEVLANETPEGHAYDAKTTDAVTKHADPAKDAPVRSPNVAEVLPAAKPTLGLSIRKQTYSYMTGIQLQQHPQQPPIND